MKIPTITVPTEDGPLSYHVLETGGIEVYDEEGELVMFLTRSPSYVYPLLKILAERCPDLIVETF